MPLNPRCPNLAAEGQARQDPCNFQRGQIFQQNQVEPAVLHLRFGCQAQSRSITRRVQNPQQQRRSFEGRWLGILQRNPHFDPSESSQRANRRKQISASTSHLPVSPARKSRRLRVQPHSTPAHIEAFRSIGGTHTRCIQWNRFSLRENHFCGTNRIPWQSQRRGQIISSAGRQHADRDAGVSCHCVQQRLKSSIAAQGEDSLAASRRFLTRNLREFPRTLRATEFRFPLFFQSERLQPGQSFAPAPSASRRVRQYQIRNLC